MRYIRHNFVDNYNSFDGSDRKKIVVDELAKLLVLYPVEVSQVLLQNGVDVPPNSSESTLAYLIEQNKSNKALIEEISTLLLSVNRDLSFDGELMFLGGKGDGKWKDKLKDFYSNNKDKIGDVANVVSDIFDGSASSRNEVSSAVKDYKSINVPNVPKRAGSGNTTLILGVLGVLTIGLIGVLIWKGKNN